MAVVNRITNMRIVLISVTADGILVATVFGLYKELQFSVKSKWIKLLIAFHILTEVVHFLRLVRQVQ